MTVNERLKNMKGILIRVSDKPFLDLEYNVPGWECEICGWRVGSSGYPPSHNCPDEGIQQQCKHEWLPDSNTTYGKKELIIQRECSKCGKREHRYQSNDWLD